MPSKSHSLKVAGLQAELQQEWSVFSELNSLQGLGCSRELIGLEQKVEQADLVFTAEGKIDQQSLQGKVPVGVARIAKKYHKKCIGLAGIVEPPFFFFL